MISLKIRSIAVGPVVNIYIVNINLSPPEPINTIFFFSDLTIREIFNGLHTDRQTHDRKMHPQCKQVPIYILYYEEQSI